MSHQRDELPVLDLTCLSKQDLGGEHALSEESARLCQLVAKSLRETGCAVVKHPRVDSNDNEQFLDLMEQYFAQPTALKMQDVRADLHYQVGATPSYVETPRILVDKEMQEAAGSLPEGHRPVMPTGPDPKWRFFWNLGPRPSDTQFKALNPQPVVPQGFPNWSSVLDSWGQRMLAVADTVAHAAALGLGLPASCLSSLLHEGPHLLAPTGSDLSGELAQEGKVFAGFHSDLNFLTLHGRSRFPGLFVWLRDGRRVAVRVPAGCLFVQAGKQLEWLTGGHIMAGMHEVVVSKDTLHAVEAARSAGRPLWRVSSTVFCHVASQKVLQPLGQFATSSALAAYPPTTAGDQVQRELEAIQLKKVSSRDSDNEQHVAAASTASDQQVLSNTCRQVEVSAGPAAPALQAGAAPRMTAAALPAAAAGDCDGLLQLRSGKGVGVDVTALPDAGVTRDQHQ